jgi:hypothetical protein
MTRAELIEYIEKHPKWRCPNKDEAQKILETLNEKVAFRLAEDNYKSIAFASNNEGQVEFSHINGLVKLDVFLVPVLENCKDTGTILYVEFDNQKDLSMASIEYDFPYSRKDIIETNHLGKFNDIIKSMTYKDYVIFKRATKTMKVIIKETLEKVVEIDCSAKLDKNDILSHIEDMYLNEDINLQLEDYKGDYSIAECLNCDKEKAKYFISIDNEFNTEVTRVSNDL